MLVVEDGPEEEVGRPVGRFLLVRGGRDTVVLLLVLCAAGCRTEADLPSPLNMPDVGLLLAGAAVLPPSRVELIAVEAARVMRCELGSPLTGNRLGETVRALLLLWLS